MIPHRIWNSNSGQIEHYERLLRECPSSTYAVHARFYLAQAYESSGEERPNRGASAGRAALERAAALYLSAAEQAKSTPMGVYSSRLGARCLAKVGRDAEAQRVFEDAFAATSAGDEDRLETLLWLGHLETGFFGRSSGLADVNQGASGHVRLPLRRFAEALGFSVCWDANSKTVSIGKGVMCRELCLKRDGKQARPEGTIEKGRAQVRPSVIASIMAEHRGKGVAGALSSLLAQAPDGDK